MLIRGVRVELGPTGLVSFLLCFCFFVWSLLSRNSVYKPDLDLTEIYLPEADGLTLALKVCAITAQGLYN